MENKNASWIKGPLPPLAESILMSGLVSNKGAPNNSIIVTSASSDSLENINLHPSVSHTIGNRTKQPQKINSSSPPPNFNNEDGLSRTAIVSSNKAKSTFVSPQKKRSSISSVSQLKNQIDNKVPRQKSDVVFVINPKNGLNHNTNSIQSTNINESFGMSTTISSKRNGNASIGESTNSIVSELDANIALLNNPDNPILSQSCSDQVSFKEQLIKIHNYSFNQLILHEKSICSDRALLLRRLMKFYNSLIEEIPEMKDHIKQEEETFSETIEKLKTEKEEIEKKYQYDSNIEKELREHIKELEEKNKELTEESNKKDLTISSTTFETDYLKGQIVQLQFKLQNKKQRRQMLKKAISQMEEESQAQLNQIDSLTKVLESMNQGETGYIQKYHQVQKELEESKKEIEDLKFQINNVPVIVKADISVDTSDLPAPTKKKAVSPESSQVPLPSPKNVDKFDSEFPLPNKKNPQVLSNQFKRVSLSRRQSTHVISPSMINPNILGSVSEKKKKNTPSLLQGLPPPKFDNRDLTEMFKLSEKKNATIQTSPRLAETLPITSNAIDYNNVNFANEKSKPNTERSSKIAKQAKEEEKINTDGKYHSKIDQITFLFPLPDNYKIDEKMVDSVPDILKMIMPILSRPYVGRHPNDLKILDNNVTTQHQIVSNQKPLVWALQLIHNFLLDPYLRSNEHLEKLSIEPIFIDWITSRYKLQHLVNQVITDFSSLLVSNRCISAIMSLFYDILEGQYTITELSFFSTLYSFSNQFTYPSLPKCLEEMSIESSGYDQFSIHISIAAKIFAKCFTSEIADTFLLQMAKKIKEKEESPLINYFDFLKSAMEFFGEKHKTLYLQSKNLLLISGCSDHLVISYDPFVTFMTFLDYDGKDLRKEWKGIKSLSSILLDDDNANASKNDNDKQQDTVKLRDLMSYLAEKETQFVNLLNMIPMHQSVLILKSFSSVISNLFIDLIKRFMKIKKLQPKFPASVNEKIKDDLNELKVSYLCANIPRILWYYRVILMKIDKCLMKDKGYIPFHPQSSVEVIKQLVEYLDRAESVSFALLS